MIIYMVFNIEDTECYSELWEEADRVYKEYVIWRESEKQEESNADSN